MNFIQNNRLKKLGIAVVAGSMLLTVQVCPAQEVGTIAVGANAELIKTIEFTNVKIEENKTEEPIAEETADQLVEEPVIEAPEVKQYDSIELLAVCVQAEAGGESYLGKQMVCDVILNRVDDADWPDTVEGVITDPYEFSSYWDGGMAKVVEPSAETYAAVEQELKERAYPGIYYFTAYEYSAYGTPWKQVGNHYFSTK